MAITINQAGLDEIMTGPLMQRALKEAADVVADNVRAQDIKVGDVNGGADEIPLPVETEVFVNGRSAEALVTINHPAGLAVQAKHGSLTKAAAQTGLTVRGTRP